MGESGCGKSTLTRAILGLEEVQSGEIELAGAPVFTGHKPNPEVRRKMQVVFQDPYGSFNPRHRVARLVAEPFHLLPDTPRAERDRAVAEALEAVGLSAADGAKLHPRVLRRPAAADCHRPRSDHPARADPAG